MIRQFVSAGFVFLIVSPLLANAQYTDRAAMQDLGGPQEFAARRTELAGKLKTGYVLLFAKTQEPPADHYREDNDFYYYTGLSDPGAILLMDVATQRTTIFEPQQSPREIQVYGANLLSMSKDEQKELGYAAVAPLTSLDGALSFLFGNGVEHDLWVRLGFADKPDGARFETGRDYAAEYNNPYGQELPGDRDVLLSSCASAILPPTSATLPARWTRCATSSVPAKSKSCAAMGASARKAISRPSPTPIPACTSIRSKPRRRSYFAIRARRDLAYPAIVGSGKNANTWHYFFNRSKIEPGSIVVFDFAADLDHMTMDITRTFNIDGKFTPEQAKWYNVDLECQKAVIAMLRPGNTYEQAAEAGKKVFDREGIGSQWYGWPGHFVGLATHDVMLPKGPILAGQVVTVEPIVEFPDKHWHFRVEDTILITPTGAEVLSSSVPKEMSEVEKLVGSAPAPEPVK